MYFDMYKHNVQSKTMIDDYDNDTILLNNFIYACVCSIIRVNDEFIEYSVRINN